MLKNCSNIFFNNIIKYVLITTIIASSFTAVGCSKNANGVNKVKNISKLSESTLISNLNKSLKVIKAAQEKKQCSLSMLDDVYNNLSAIESSYTADSKIFKDKNGKLKTDVCTAMTDTESTLTALDLSKIDKEYAQLQIKCLDIKDELTKIKVKFGLITEAEAKTVLASDTKFRSIFKNNPNYMKGVTFQDGTGGGGMVEVENGSGGSQNSSSTQTPAQYKGYRLVSARLSTVNSDAQIYVKYGSHTYGCKNQAEYDAVLAKVEDAVKNLPALDNYIVRYMNGDRAEKYPQGSDDWAGLTAAYKKDGYFIYKLNNNDLATRALQAIGLCGRFMKQAACVEGSPNSAYDVLFLHQEDCDAEAQLLSAIHDAMGYNSMIGNSSTHADEYVNINGQWWKDTVPANPNSVAHLTEPTF